MAKRKRKSLPRGNLEARGNLRPGKRGVMGPTSKGVIMFGSARFPGYRMPFNYGVKPPHEYHPPPGGENAGLPENGPPGSEWWNQPQYKRS